MRQSEQFAGQQQRSYLVMARLRALFALVIAVATVLTSLIQANPAKANVVRLVLHTRTCGTVSAYVIYDSFSEGVLPFWAVFNVDLNGNGIYGEAGEPIQYVKLSPSANGQSLFVGTTLKFRP